MAVISGAAYLSFRKFPFYKFLKRYILKTEFNDSIPCLCPVYEWHKNGHCQAIEEASEAFGGKRLGLH
jgi:hypothetical protein